MSAPVLTPREVAVLRTASKADFSESQTFAREHSGSAVRELRVLCRHSLLYLSEARRADGKPTDLYSITRAGRRLLEQLDAEGMPLPVAERRAGIYERSADSYAGEELEPYEGRPGAMDAFTHPSRMGDRLHYRDGRVVPFPGKSST